MVNLNAPRNLPPESTPWGKRIDAEISGLAKDTGLMRNELTNTSKGLNNLLTRLGSLGIIAGDSNGWNKTVSSGGALSGTNVYDGRYADLNISIPVRGRTAQVLLLGVLSVQYTGNQSPTVEIIPYVLSKDADKTEVDWASMVGNTKVNSVTSAQDGLGVPLMAYMYSSVGSDAVAGAVIRVTSATSGSLRLQPARLTAITF